MEHHLGYVKLPRVQTETATWKQMGVKVLQLANGLFVHAPEDQYMKCSTCGKKSQQNSLSAF